MHSQLSNRFLPEGGHITEKLFNPARHLQGITGGSVLFKWLLRHVKNAVVSREHMPNHLPFEGKEHWLALSSFELLGHQDFSVAPRVPWASRGLGPGDPAFHSKLEPLPSTRGSRAWNWKHRHNLGRGGIRYRPQRNSTFIFPITRVFGLAQPTQLSQKFFFVFSSGVVRTSTFTFQARVRQSSDRTVHDLALELLSSAEAWASQSNITQVVGVS